MICKATITAISKGRLKVKTLTAASGCGDCNLAQSCCSSKPSSTVSRFTVKVADTTPYKIGQEIYLEQSGVTRKPMLIYAVIIPLIILALLVIAFLDHSDPTLGTTLGIIAVALYFIAMRKLHAPLSPHPLWRVKTPGNQTSPQRTDL